MDWKEIKRMAGLKKRISILNRLKDEIESQSKPDINTMPLLAEELRSQGFSRIVICSTLLLFFTPRSIIGEKIPRNMRGRIAAATECDPGYVSRRCGIVMFLHDNDKSFREEMDKAIQAANEYYMNMK